MATTSVAPIDFERLLLEGAEEANRLFPRLEPTKPPGGPKPDLEDALLNRYNRNRDPKDRLAPGQLPAPTVAPEPPPTPSLLDRTRGYLPGIPSVNLQAGQDPTTGLIGTPTAPAPTGTTPGAVSTAPQPYTSRRDLPRTVDEQGNITISTPESAPAALDAKERTLNKSRGWLHSFGEAAFTTVSDIAAGAFGAATAVSDILNAQLARIAKGGPFAGGPESNTHYRDIFKRMDETVSKIQYQPQTDAGKAARKVTGAATQIVGAIADLPGRALVATGVLNEDIAKVLGFATELYLFYKLDAGVRKVAPELRAKISDFKTRMSKARTDADVAGVADDLATAASRNPRLEAALDEARGKFRDEADFEAGREPRGPKPPDEGPAGGGAYYDPAELAAFRDNLRNFLDDYRAKNPNAGFSEIREASARYTEQQGPQPKPRPAPEAPRPAPEPQAQRAAPAAEVPRAAPTAERPVQPEVVVGTETAVAPRTTTQAVPRAQSAPEPVRPTPPAEPTRPTTEQVREAVLRPQEPTSTGQYTPLPLTPREQQAAATVPTETVPAPVSTEPSTVAAAPTSRQGYFGWEGTHTAESAIARAQELGVLNIIRTDLNQGITLEDAAANARQKATGRLQRAEAYAVVEAIKNNPDVALAPLREMLDTGRLAELKSLAREAANGANIILGLSRLGFPRDEIRSIAEQLRKVRAKKAGTSTLQEIAEKPAVQTAATEAALDNTTAGTEVEIPAPSEPVVDTAPVVEKPKRKRRVVKAPESELPELSPEAQADMYARGQQRAPQGAVPAGVATPNARYYQPANLDDMGKAARVGLADRLPLENATPLRAPVQLRFSDFTPEMFGKARGGAKPDAIFIDTTGLNTQTSLADIQKQMQSRRMSEEVGQAMIANLERQAQLFFQDISVAHRYTGQELTRMATQLAAETGIDLYVKKGKNYELVPKDVVRTDARLNNGDDLAPKPISREAAGAYAESKTSDVGPATIREITDAIERGIDITDKLPSELVPHYQQLRDSERNGIDTSERRAFLDILTDILTSESGAINVHTVRMAAQRLQADFRKAGKDVREFLFGARPEDVVVFEQYLDRINNPAPPDSTNPRNMRFDPTAPRIPGDRVVKQRVTSKGTYPPLWRSEVNGIQNARDIKAGGGHWDLKLPLRQHKKAGTEFLYYAYRTAQKNKNAALNDLHADMQELARGFSSRSLENIGANGYQRQGPDGQRILTFNKVTPRPLNTTERNLQATIDQIYEATYNQLNIVRAATGREPLPHVDDYQTFARTISLLNQLGIKVDLARDPAADINAMYVKHRATNFPYYVRKHAFYTAEMNALKILDRYMQSALSDIHLSPFLAKMHELTETLLPDPVTGEETWALKDQKPGLYNELTRWTNYIATGTNYPQLEQWQRTVLNTLNQNVAYATLSGLIRSGGIQISTLVNTQHALGPINTLRAMMDNLADHAPGPNFHKRRQFALENSEILSSRKFVDAYNEVAGAIIGRRPRDFFHAIRTGDLSGIQQAIGRPGFKLMELMDMEAALMAWNGAYKQASKKLGYDHKESVRYADDLVVRTQGSTMPGDLSGIQRNALGKLITQFQTFLISDWNFLTNEVLTKGKPGGGGGGQIPPGGGVASGSGSWEVPGSRSTFQLVKNILGFLIATQLMNELFKLLHIQPAQPDPVKDIQQGLAAGHGPVGLAFDLAIGQTERIPIWGGLRYGKGITGPVTETVRELARAGRGDPLVRNPYESFYKETFGMPKGEAQLASKMTEPAATLIGIPGTRQVAKTALALKRGESLYDSLMGWYSTERAGERARPERIERRAR